MAKRKYIEGDVYTSNYCGSFEIKDYAHSKKVLVRFLDTGYEYWTSISRIVKGEVKDRSLPYMLFNVGLNDADYPVETYIGGVRWVCPFFRVWKNMLSRCYHSVMPSYLDCYVNSSWLTFSNFKIWMEGQEWDGMQLDKDLLVEGNREYGPNTCLFVTAEVNQFIVTRTSFERELPTGVTQPKDRPGVYIAQCGSAKSTKSYVGSYESPEEAHLAWKSAKHKLAMVLAEKQKCLKTAEALRQKYA